MSNVTQTMGDERFYLESSGRLWSLLSVGPQSEMAIGELGRSLVQAGWFMPGMSLVLTPLTIVTQDIIGARWYMGAVNLVGIVIVARSLSAMFGGITTPIFVALLLTSPRFGLMSFTLWGDVTGGLVLVIVLLGAVRASTTIQETGRIPARQLVGIGFGIAAMIYVRPPLVLVAPILAVLLVYPGLMAGWATARAAAPEPGRILSTQFVQAIARPVGIATALAAVVLALVLPWTALLSWKTGSPYLLTTTSDLGWIMAFGDPDDVSEVGPTFGAWHAHVAQKAELGHISYREAAELERDRVAQNVTTEEYWRRARVNFGRYLDSENAFPERFRAIGDSDAGFGLRDQTFSLLYGLNSAHWLMLPGLTIASLAILAMSRTNRPLSLAAVTVLSSAMIFPLLSRVNGRHSVDYLPLSCALIAIAVAELADKRQAVAGGAGPPGSPPLSDV